MRGGVLLVSVLAALALAASARANTFIFGFADDSAESSGRAALAPAFRLGATGLRVTLQWRLGEVGPSTDDLARLGRVVDAAQGLHLFVSVFGPQPPLDPFTREQYCSYVTSVVLRFPAIDGIVIWNEPNLSYFWRPQFAADGSSAAPAAYEALLARCWDLLHAARPAIQVVAPATSPRGYDDPGAKENVSHSPGMFIRELGVAYRRSGRTRPIFDTVGHHVYGERPDERPWFRHTESKWLSEGDWNKLMRSLAEAFGGTAQPIPGQCSDGRCPRILYLEDGFETRVDPGKAHAYVQSPASGDAIPDDAGGEPDVPMPEDSPAPDQATQIVDAVRLAYCQPYVEGFLNFLLYDEPTVARWQTGAYWADGTAKDSAAAFARVGAEVRAGSVRCDLLKGGRPSADYTPPGTPVGVTARVRRRPLRVDIQWNPVLDEGGRPADGYRVYRNGTLVGFVHNSAFTDLTAKARMGYSYAVAAEDAAGNLGNRSEQTRVWSGDGSPPSQPERFRAVVRLRPLRVVLTWNASSDDVGVSRYRLVRDGVHLASTRRPLFVDRRVRRRARARYSVRAYDAAGNVSPPTSRAVVICGRQRRLGCGRAANAAGCRTERHPGCRRQPRPQGAR